MTELEDALIRLGRLEDEQAILRTLYKYAHSLDAGLPDDWLACFTADVDYEVRYPMPPEPARVAKGTQRGSSVFHKGLDQMKAFVTSVIERGGPTRKHMICEPRIELAGDEATGVTYYFTVDYADGAPEVLTFGRYLDSYRRVDGRWLIANRIVDTQGQRPK